MERRGFGEARSAGGFRGRGLGWLAVVVAFAATTAVLLGMSAMAGEAQEGGFLAREGTPPPGANDPDCRPSKRHPYPVVLVHGTFETMDQNWAVLSPRLKAKGYCVYALNYNNRGMGDIRDSARELDVFVNRVLRLTGARKVQLVGHSQGGMMPRQWIKFLGGAPLVEDLVGIAPSNYGTELNDASSGDATPADWGLNFPDPSARLCKACEQQSAGSPFLRRLNSGDDTPGGGSFTQIATDDDEIIIPYTRCYLKGERRTVNLRLQRFNGGLPVTHQNIYNDPYAQALVFDALDNPGPADPRRTRFPTG